MIEKKYLLCLVELIENALLFFSSSASSLRETAPVSSVCFFFHSDILGFNTRPMS